MDIEKQLNEILQAIDKVYEAGAKITIATVEWGNFEEEKQ